MPKLLVTYPDSGEDQTHELSGEIVTIGRSSDNKVQIGHESIAAHHAQLVRKNGHYQLKDMSPTRTSSVNGAPVREAMLKGSCILRFGAVECVFREEPPGKPAEQPDSQLAEAKRKIEALIRARDALHEQATELVKQRNLAEEERAILSDEIGEHRARVDDLERECSRASTEREALAADLELLKQDIAAAFAKAGELRGEADQIRKEKEEADKERDVSKETLGETLRRLAESEASVAELARVRQQTQEAAAQISELKREREQLAETLATAQREKNEVAERVAQITGELTAAVAAAEAEKSQLAGLKAGIEETRQELEATRQDRANLEEKLTQAGQQIESLNGKQEDHSKLAAEAKNLRRQLDDAHLEHKHFARRTHELNAALETSRAETAAAAGALEAAASGKGEMEARLADALQQTEKAKQDGAAAVEQLSAKLAIATRGLDAGNQSGQRAAELAAELSRTQAELATANEQRKNAEHGQAELLAKLSELHQKNEGLNGELEAAHRRDQDLAKQVAELRDQLATQDHEFQRVQNLCGELKTQLAEAIRELDSARSEREEVAHENLALAGKIEAQGEQLATAGKNLASAQANSEELQAKLADQCQASQNLARELEIQISKLEKELTEANSEREGISQKNQLLAEKIGTQDEQIAALAKGMDSTRTGSEELQARVSELEKQLTAARAERDGVATEKQSLAEKIEEQSRQLEALGKNADSAQTSSDNFTAKLAEAEKRIHELSESTVAHEARARENAAEIALHRSEIGELTKQRDALLETTRRLAAEREVSEERNPMRDAASERAVPAAAPHQNREGDGAPTAAPAEAASWLKRTFQRIKHSETGAGKDRSDSASSEPNHQELHSINLNSLRAAGNPPARRSDALPKAEAGPSPALPIPAGMVAAPRPEILRSAMPELIVEIRRSLQYFIRHTNDLELLNNLLARSSEISRLTAQAGYPLLHTATSALEALFTDLYNMPARITPSTIRTLGQSIDFVHTLLEEAHLPRLASEVALKAIAIEDEPEVLEGIVAALESVRLRTCATRQATPAFALLSAQKFDLIMLDVGLPDMNGIELCGKIRGMAQHRKTPIVFLTGMTTVEHRAQSTLHGGNDFIAKPFHLSELSMKAATWMLKGYLGIH